MTLTLYTHLAVAALAGAGAWVFQDARLDAAVAEVRLVAADEKLQAQAKTRTAERSISTTYQKALNDARARETTLRRDRDALHAATDSLRQQNTDAARRLAAAPAPAILEYAAALNLVFADCREAYAGMASAADGHRSDVQTLIEAWPVNPPITEDK